MLTDPLGDGISAVELLDSMGNDLSVVNAARVSYAKQSDVMSVKDEKLIMYLMKHKHGSPFEHVVFQFRVRAPLFVVHQWERHRMASYNEESGRYIELRPDFYTPGNGNESFAGMSEMEIAQVTQEMYTYWYVSFDFYTNLLRRGVKKELARSVLPLSLYKEFWFTVNARSLMNFLSLRDAETAQEEIRLYAQALEQIFAKVAPAVQQAFVLNGRVAP